MRLTGASGQVLDIEVPVNVNGQITDLNLSFIVSQLEVDPDTHVLSRNNSNTLCVDSAFAKANNAISPNPATNFFTIQTTLQVSFIKVHDLQGRFITQYAVQNDALTFPVPANSGLYVLSIHAGNAVYHKRLVVN